MCRDERVESGRGRLHSDSIRHTQATRTPTGAARITDIQIRGEDARGEGYNGWRWWEFKDDDGNWKAIETLKD